jgi:hypothetical protein
MATQSLHHTRERSFFLPALLIAIGGLWLLGNLGVLGIANLAMLARLWPLILIVLGVYIFVKPRYEGIRSLIALGGIGLIVVLTLVGPALGWSGGAEAQAATYAEPLNGAETASIRLDLAAAETVITPLTGSDELFNADIRYIGEVTFDVSGGANRQVHLRNETRNLQWFNFSGMGDGSLRWNVGLNTTVPLSLTINGGAGSANLDLMDVMLTGLDYNMGAGSLDLQLPGTEDPYRASINGGAGSVNISIEEGAALTLDIDGGAGSLVLDVPDDAAVRINGQTGVGSINVPAGYERIEGGEDFVGMDGVWVSPTWEGADRQIDIVYNGGVGSVTIR